MFDNEKVVVGDIFIEKDTRMTGRTLKVLAVFMPKTYDVSEGFVVCSSRRKGTIISYKRLIDESRFEQKERTVEMFC